MTLRVNVTMRLWLYGCKDGFAANTQVSNACEPCANIIMNHDRPEKGLAYNSICV